jgi:hypothetical protein
VRRRNPNHRTLPGLITIIEHRTAVVAEVDRGWPRALFSRVPAPDRCPLFGRAGSVKVVFKGGYRGYLWCTNPAGERYRKYAKGKTYDDTQAAWVKLRNAQSLSHSRGKPPRAW